MNPSLFDRCEDAFKVATRRVNDPFLLLSIFREFRRKFGQSFFENTFNADRTFNKLIRYIALAGFSFTIVLLKSHLSLFSNAIYQGVNSLVFNAAIFKITSSVSDIEKPVNAPGLQRKSVETAIYQHNLEAGYYYRNVLCDDVGITVGYCLPWYLMLVVHISAPNVLTYIPRY